MTNDINYQWQMTNDISDINDINDKRSKSFIAKNDTVSVLSDFSSNRLFKWLLKLNRLFENSLIMYD